MLKIKAAKHSSKRFHLSISSLLVNPPRILAPRILSPSGMSRRQLEGFSTFDMKAIAIVGVTADP